MAPVALTDGGIETILIFHEGFELPCFASFPLLGEERGRAALRRYFEPFLDTAQEHGLPFVLDTATWRANPDWGARLGYDDDALAAANREAVAFARELAAGRSDVTINGVLGPRGDGYVVGERMSADEAAEYHGCQIGVLREAGAERITALTLTYPEEAIGVVQAAVAAGRAGRRVLHGRDRRPAAGRHAGRRGDGARRRRDRRGGRVLHAQLRAPDAHRRRAR